MHSNNNTLMDNKTEKKYDYESLRKKRSVCTKLCVSVILNIILIALLALCALIFMFADSESPSTSSQSCYNFSSDHLTNLFNENFTAASSDETGNSTVTIVPESEDPFVGTYALDTSENFDAFLKELGVGYLKRQIAKRTKSTYEITRNDDVYTLKTLSSVSSSEISFKLNGEEFEEDRLDGNRVKSKMIRSGNKWIQKQFGEKEVTLIREFDGDIIKLTCIVNGVTAVRVYKRVPIVEDSSS